MKPEPAARLRFDTGGFCITFVFGMVMFTLLPVGWLNRMTHEHPVLALCASGILFVFLAMVQGGLRLQDDKVLKGFLARGDFEQELGWTLSSMFGFVATFAVFIDSLNRVFTGQFQQVSDPGLFTWLLFSLENVLDIVLFGIPDIYDTHISAVMPRSFAAKTILVIFRLVVELELIITVVRFITIFRRAKRGDESQD